MFRKLVATTAITMGLAFASSASALTVWTQTPNFSEMLYNTNVATAQQNLNTVSKPGDYLVNFASLTSTNLVQSGSGAGHAWIAGDAGAAVQNLLITPVADPLDGHPDLLGFTQFGLTIEFLNKVTVPAPTDRDPNKTKDVNLQSESFLTTVTFSNGGSLTFTLPGPLLSSADFPASGQFNFASDPSTEGYITSIELFNVDYYADKNQSGAKFSNLGFKDFKQPSFDAVPAGGVVPEPATWALMILGFGGAGAMLRRRRTALA